MASRVNTKFVIILASALMLVAAGVVALGVFALQNRGERFVRQGDAAFAEGNYEEAAELYERAVGQERTNLDRLVKWRDTLVLINPETPLEYEKQYEYYYNVLRNISELDPRNAEAHLAFMEELDERVRAGGAGTSGLELIIREVDTRLDDLDPEEPGAKQLRGYRGRAQAELMRRLEVDEDLRRQALEDLEAALEADPDDVELALGILAWHTGEIDRLRTAGRRDLIDDALQARREAADLLLESFGPDPRLLQTDLSLRIEEGIAGATEPAERNEVLRTFRPQVETIFDRYESLPAEQLDANYIALLDRVARRVIGAEAAPRVRSLIDRAIEAQPEDVTLLLVSGQLYRNSGEPEMALAEYQKIIDLPTPPISLEGLMLRGRQDAALAEQVDAALLGWSLAEDDARKQEWLDRAQDLRDQLAGAVGGTSPALLLRRDARIALARERYDIAVDKLAELRAIAPPDPDLLSLLATALIEQANWGEAKAVLEELIELGGRGTSTLERLARVEFELKNFENALAIYRELQEVFPENEALAERINALREALGETAGGESADPIVRGLLDARAAIREGDNAEARRIVRGLLGRAPGDYRVVRQLVQLELTDGDRDAAIATVERAIAASPDDARLRTMKTQLEIEDPVEARLAIIADSDAPEHEKAVARFRVFEAAGRTDEADAALDRANELAPDDPVVVETRFVRALNRDELEQARRIARRGAELNADQAEGQLFQARIEIAEERFQDAADTLRSIVDANPYNPAVWRLLAETQARIGRISDAIASYERAMSGRPDDIQTAKGYARLLLRANRGPDALEVVQTAMRRGEPDEELGELWLGLQSAFGDAEEATAIREERFQRDPSNTENALALVRLYISEGRADDASRVLDRVERSGDVDPTVVSAARASIAMQGEGGVDEAARIYDQFLADAETDEQRLNALMSKGELMLSSNRFDAAERAFERAREFQDAGQRRADRRLGDFHYQIGNLRRMGSLQGDPSDAYAEAASAYENAIEGISDPEVRRAVRKRYAETLLNLERLDDARAVLADLERESPDDLEVLVLGASLAEAAGDLRAAREKLDVAVQRFPGRALPFFRRALLNRTEPSLFSDVVDDLQRVTTLEPGNIEAWQMLFGVYAQRGNVESGLSELQKGLEANPDSDQLRAFLVNRLVQLGRNSQAEALVLEQVQRRPDDPRWMETAADLLYRGGRFDDAAGVLRELYEIDDSARVAIALLDAELRSNISADRAQINRLRLRIEDEAQDSVDGLMLMARAHFELADRTTGAERADHQAEAMEATGKALAMAKDDSALSRRFIDQLRLALTNEEVLEYLQTMASAGRDQGRESLSPYLRVVLAQIRLEEGESTPAEVLASLEDIERQILAADDPDTEQVDDALSMFNLLRLRGNLQYLTGSFEDAARAMRRAVEINPNSSEMNNNLAYTLAAQLGRYEEALPYAERARELSPSSSPTLDTLGVIYLELGRTEDAVDVLTRASQTATSVEQEFVALVHLGRAEYELGDTAAAARRVGRLERLIAENPDVAPDYRDEYEALRSDVD